MARQRKVKSRKQIIAALELQTAVAQLAATGVPLDTKQASVYTGFASGSLEIYRSKGGGPKVTYCNSRPRYLKADLDAWLTSGRQKAERVRS